ncbi:Molybdenum cofactor sulfurase [Galdieria sulphuraria]|nr:Molybdenum cofactor sulfurase [Galdieria sulphuraria]
MDFIYPKIHSYQQNETEKIAVYLDAVGSALYSTTQVRECYTRICQNGFVNPHSLPEGFSESLERVRARVLRFFGASSTTHDVVFTSGATAGLKLVGENFQWKQSNGLIYVTDCHSSALGIREYAARAGTAIYPIDRNWCKNWLSSILGDSIADNRTCKKVKSREDYALFVYTGESNFCGTRYHLDFCRFIHQNGLFDFDGENIVTLVDGAKLAASHPINLDLYSDVDILVASFYKIFGYPTGVGCIILRKDRPRILHTLSTKCYHGGGTILLANAQSLQIFPKRSDNFHDTWEDGTLNFVDILVGLDVGLNWIEYSIGGMKVIENHIYEIYCYAREQLVTLQYSNGQSIIHMYEEDDCYGTFRLCERGGSILTMNVRLPDGSFMSPLSIYYACLSKRILLRSGMLCNPGGCQFYLGFTEADICHIAKLSSSCWDRLEYLDGKVIGAVRISFGVHSRKEDILKLVTVLKEICHMAWEQTNSGPADIGNHRRSNEVTEVSLHSNRFYVVDEIFIYPIKGCRGMSVKQWPISSEGFLYDRKYCLVHSITHSLLSIRNHARISALHVSINLTITKDTGSTVAELVFESTESVEGFSKILKFYEWEWNQQKVHCWLSSVLMIPCQLMTIEAYKSQYSSRKGVKGKKYRNDAHLLVICGQSVEKINDLLQFQNKKPVLAEVFRPNLVVKQSQVVSCSLSKENRTTVAPKAGPVLLSLEEDRWKDIAWLSTNNFSDEKIQMEFVGDCIRCMTICIDPESGNFREDREPWLSLSTYRRVISEREEDSKTFKKDRIGKTWKGRGPLFGRLYNVSMKIDQIRWIYLEGLHFETERA